MKLSNKYRNPKEINANMDNFKNPFQRLKNAREKRFNELMNSIPKLLENTLKKGDKNNEFSRQKKNRKISLSYIS